MSAQGIPIQQVIDQSPQVRDLARWVTWAGLLFLAVSLAIGFRAGLALLTVLGFGAALVGLVHPLPGFLGVGLLCTLDPVMRVYLFSGGLFPWNLFNYLLLFAMALAAPRLIRRNDLHGRPASPPARPDPGTRLEPRSAARAPPHPGRLDLLRRPSLPLAARLGSERLVRHGPHQRDRGGDRRGGLLSPAGEPSADRPQRAELFPADRAPELRSGLSRRFEFEVHRRSARAVGHRERVLGLPHGEPRHSARQSLWLGLARGAAPRATCPLGVLGLGPAPGLSHPSCLSWKRKFVRAFGQECRYLLHHVRAHERSLRAGTRRLAFLSRAPIGHRNRELPEDLGPAERGAGWGRQVCARVGEGHALRVVQDSGGERSLRRAAAAGVCLLLCRRRLDAET